MNSQKQMNEYWHIPRASLAPSVASSSAVSSISSSNRSNKSFSNPPTLPGRATTKAATTRPQQTVPSNNNKSKHNQRHFNHNNNNSNNNTEQLYSIHNTSNNHHTGNYKIAVIEEVTPRPSQNYPSSAHNKRVSTNSDPAVTAAAAAAVLAAAASAKRGSRSSQGSNDSNNSTRSAASGSLLLTAANLERFAEIQKQNSKIQNEYLPSVHNQHLNYHKNNNNQKPSMHNKYNANIINVATTTSTMSTSHHNHQHNNNHLHDYSVVGSSHRSNHSHSNNNFIGEDGNQYQQHHGAEGNNDSIIQMDPNLNFIKTKDLDTVSIASSMHFTMVNGEAGQTKKPKRGLCDRGRQVTVLIVSMSTIFMLLIMGMVYALEMRAREMPQS